MAVGAAPRDGHIANRASVGLAMRRLPASRVTEQESSRPVARRQPFSVEGDRRPRATRTGGGMLEPMTRHVSLESETLSEHSYAWRVPPLTAFPLSYALHVSEEAWGGDTFPVWASRLSGASFTHEEFIVLNSAAFAVMCVAVALASQWSQARRIVTPALGTIVAANGALHVVASLWSGTYSPGLLSGALLWLPLGAFTLRWAVRTLPRRQLLSGCALGVLAHAAVSAIAVLH